jgi:hypothetical protein
MGVAVDSIHVGYFVKLVGICVLENAQRVDPEILKPDGLRHSYSVLNSLRDYGQVQSFFRLAQIVGGEATDLGSIPAIRQSCISSNFTDDQIFRQDSFTTQSNVD